jgi:hypothetical protein
LDTDSRRLLRPNTQTGDVIVEELRFGCSALRD